MKSIDINKYLAIIALLSGILIIFLPRLFEIILGVILILWALQIILLLLIDKTEKLAKRKKKKSQTTKV